MKRTKEFYLLLLEYALIEIRATQYEDNLALGPKLADIFHNLPGALRFPWTTEREERIYVLIRDKAQVYGLTEKLDRWAEHALRNLQEAEKSSMASS